MINDTLSFIAIASFVLAMALLVSGLLAIDRLENPTKERLTKLSGRYGVFVETLIFFVCVGALSAVIYLHR